MLEVLRHQHLEGVMASVVRYFGGVKLGAGGLVRAYTDAVAQALLKAEKVPLIPQTTLVCTVPYALEGMVRREVDLAKAQLLKVEHSSGVCLMFSLPQSEAESMVVRLNDLGHGQLGWSDPDLLA
jgi:putative IMPACT (imprinted ancient) family translation regulator